MCKIMALPKKRRLKRPFVEKALKQGKRISSRYLSLVYFENSSCLSSFAFIVPSAVSKKAVLRNRLKRRARAIVRGLLERIKEGYGVVIFFKKGSEQIKFSQIKEEIEFLFKKANFFK